MGGGDSDGSNGIHAKHITGPKVKQNRSDGRHQALYRGLRDFLN